MALDPKWKATVDDGVTNKAWDGYDADIKSEVDGYNLRFGASPGYKNINWLMGKAILWVESGGPANPAWNKRVMQIGNPGDPAYQVLKTGAEGSSLIMSKHLATALKSKPINNPTLNIQAALAYLVSRLAKFEMKSVIDPSETQDRTYTVVAGDSLASIAAKVHTTVDLLQTMNPAANGLIFPKQVLKYRKAKMQLVIVDWRQCTTQIIAQRYNVGDADYNDKLKYVLDLFTKLKR